MLLATCSPFPSPQYIIFTDAGISPYTFFLGKLFLLLEVIVWRKTWCPINFFQPVLTKENLGDLTRNLYNSIINSWQMLLTYSCQIEENREVGFWRLRWTRGKKLAFLFLIKRIVKKSINNSQFPNSAC